MPGYDENILFDWFTDGDYYEGIFRQWMAGCAKRGLSQDEATSDITDKMNAFLRKIWYSAQDDIQDSLAKDLYFKDWGGLGADIEGLVYDLLDYLGYVSMVGSASRRGSGASSKTASSARRSASSKGRKVSTSGSKSKQTSSNRRKTPTKKGSPQRKSAPRRRRR